MFATAVSLDQFPRWSPRNPRANKLTAGQIGEGTQFQMGIKGFGKVTNELREFQADKQVMVVPLSRMFDLTGITCPSTRVADAAIGR